MRITVTLPRLFAGESLGGYEPQDFERLSMAEQLCARLSFIEERARALSNVPYDSNNGVPANVHADARRLADRAYHALVKLAAGDVVAAAWIAVDVGQKMGNITATLAVAKALDLTVTIKKPKSAGGKATAERNKKEAEDNQDIAAEHWLELAKAGRPERDRAEIIAQRMNRKANTVRGWIKKAGLR